MHRRIGGNCNRPTPPGHIHWEQSMRRSLFLERSVYYENIPGTRDACLYAQQSGNYSTMIYDRKLTASGLKGIRTFAAILFTPSIHPIPPLHEERHLPRLIAYTVCLLRVYIQLASSLSTALGERGRFALSGVLVKSTNPKKQCAWVPALVLIAQQP
jgi:hypothetical protein